ncbi:MAG: beta-N-acetylhexosaminidase [Clostridia bacterium]|nr:beta-N-acetylhexosaminidase [Clostridia bacterium]
MKKFWCLVLIAILLVGCAAESDAPIGQVTPVPETPETVETSPVGDVDPDVPPESEPTPEEVPVEGDVPGVPSGAPPTPTPRPTRSPEERLYAYIAGMTDAEKIGQLCMFGFSGTKEISADFRKIVQEYRIGNVILYGQNVSRTNGDGGFSQCRALTDSVRDASLSDIPLLISIDVEGGRVTRFRWKQTLFSAQSLGKKDDAERAREQFEYIAEGLLSAGINVDLAPCLDVAKNPAQTFLSNRIISSDEEIAARIGLACIEGLHDGGCLSVVKHFPGHGATTADSHENTPVVNKSYEELMRYELVPFAEGLKEADAVIVAHISYPEIDDAHIASQSYMFITEILRGELCFDGIVLSDDFRMEGLRKQTSLKKGAVQFILAGGDMILCGANHAYQREIVKGLAEAVENGTISEDRLNESVYRILSAKMAVAGWDPF